MGLNIEADLMQCCETCEEFSPVVKSCDAYAYGKVYIRNITVSCRDIGKCRRIKEMLKKENK